MEYSLFTLKSGVYLIHLYCTPVVTGSSVLPCQCCLCRVRDLNYEFVTPYRRMVMSNTSFLFKWCIKFFSMLFIKIMAGNMTVFHTFVYCNVCPYWHIHLWHSIITYFICDANSHVYSFSLSLKDQKVFIYKMCYQFCYCSDRNIAVCVTFLFCLFSYVIMSHFTYYLKILI